MCGVNGIWAYHRSAPEICRDEVLATSAAMKSRGPDGDGLWTSADGRLALAHRRLKIIDLSDAANQPMVSQCGRFVISYNGEIYNYRELRAQLTDRGAELRTHSDTEVIVEWFAREGIQALSRLRGMYAMAIWDQRQQKLLLARDPLGIKPLYYADDGWTLRFGSQVRALRAGGGISDAREPAGVAGFLLTGSVPEPWTLWQDIRAVPAGHHVWCAAAGPLMPECSPRPAPGEPPGSGPLLGRLLADSVTAHMTADVPVAVFLSSGIDSTVLATLARAGLERELTTVTVGFDEFKDHPEDELPLAAATAAALGTRHIEYRYGQADFKADLPAIMAAMDQPSIDGINTWIVAKACAENGIKTALSGLGADELFGGYPSFRDVPTWRRRLRPLAWIPGLGRSARILSRRWLEKCAISPKAAGMLEYGGTLPGAYLLKRGLFMPWELAGLMGQEHAREGLARLALLPTMSKSVADVGGGAHATVAALEQRWYLRNQLLRDADWAGMDHSVEIRVPFVDWPLYQHTADGRFDKQDLLAVVSEAVPRGLAQRPKTGFTTPVGRWRGGQGVGWARGWARELSCKF